MSEKEKMKNKTDVLIDSEENLSVDAILQGLVRAKHDAISDYSKERIQNGIKLIIELANYHTSAESRKTGKWEYFSEDIDGLSFGIKRCSMCGASKPMKLFHWEDAEINFCPNCGADMRGENNE